MRLYTDVCLTKIEKLVIAHVEKESGLKVVKIDAHYGGQSAYHESGELTHFTCELLKGE